MASGPYREGIMKMTMHIDEDVLAEVMDLTGAPTKTAAVEHALRDLARRHKQRRLFRTPLWQNEAEWRADVAPQPSDAIDPPDYDEAAVARFLAGAPARARSGAGAEPPPAPWGPTPTGDNPTSP
jgi:Arc/MetJ family transcription regulator